MYPAPFEYARAGSVAEAIQLLQQADGEGKILAGGHSLLPLMKLRLAQPRLLVDIGRIPNLEYVRRSNGNLEFGALATYRDIQFNSDVLQALPVVAHAVSDVGDLQVRARGTLAGGLAHSDPAADMTAVMLALGATIQTQGPNGNRSLPIDSFFVDMLTTALQDNELITAVQVPVLAPDQRAAYMKFDQPASHYALAGACAVLRLDGNTIREARLGITGVGTTAYRPTAVEQALVGREATERGVADALKDITDGIDVQGDIHASPPYRAHLAQVMAKRAIVAAAGSQH